MEGKRNYFMNLVNMYIRKGLKTNLIILSLILIYYLLSIISLRNVIYGNNIVFPYALNHFLIDIEYPEIWKYIKIYFFVINIFTPIIILIIYNFKKYETWKYLYLKNKKEESGFFKQDYISNSKIKEKKINGIIREKSLHILIGFDENKNAIYLEEKALFQNILITGSIGTGKTSSRNV